jgi:putative membrane protein
MRFLLNYLKGIAIGSGAILPGISSGVFCVIFGIYEKLLDSILNFFSDIKNNFKFLFPIILGTVFGIILFGNILNYCLYQFSIQTKSIFIGLILGSIPTLIKEINIKESFKSFYLIFFLLSFFIGIGCIFLEKYLEIYTLENISFYYLVLCGFIMSVRNCCSWC